MTRLAVVVFMSFVVTVCHGQEWYSGKGVATGNDLGKVRSRALLAARQSALEKAGITLRSMAVSVKGEANQSIVDIYGSFAETESRGMIIAERNVEVATSVVGKGQGEVLQATVTLEAQITMPEGTVDPAFHVSLSSWKEFYYEGEDLQVTVNSTQDGFLSIFQIKNDSCIILFPHPDLPVTHNNIICAHEEFEMPPKGAPYSFELTLDGGDGKAAMEFIVAIVTKDRIPIADRLTTAFFSLYQYSKWLSSIPLDRRSAASTVVNIVKR